MIFYITGGTGVQPSTVCKAYVYGSFPTPKIAENKIQDSCTFGDPRYVLNDAELYTK